MVDKYAQGQVDLSNRNSSWTKLISLVERGSRVLEFGCSSGYVSRVLRDHLGCRVVGLELSPEAAGRARDYCEEVLVGDVETLDWVGRLQGRLFDAALYGDFLEHLRSPATILRRTVPLLEADGYMLVSVPNVAHASVRLELLLGSFRGEELGILDDTHLRFFTWESLVALLEDCGLRIDHQDATTYDLPAAVVEDYLSRVGLSYAPELRREFAQDEARAYQYIVRARRRQPGEERTRIPPPPKPLDDAEDRWRAGRERIARLEKDAQELTARIRQLEAESQAKQEWILKLEADIAELKAGLKGE